MQKKIIDFIFISLNENNLMFFPIIDENRVGTQTIIKQLCRLQKRGEKLPIKIQIAKYKKMKNNRCYT